VPCETERGCPFEPSPGDCELSPSNYTAVHLFERIKSLGSELALSLIDIELTPDEAALLPEQLHTLVVYSAYLDSLTPEGPQS
jgi:hypothetical protein